MDSESAEILNLLQEQFPLDDRPFLKIAHKLNITEKKVIDTVNKLKSDGYIRRIGAILDSRKLGYFSLLCAMKVPCDRVCQVVKFINAYKGVTHNYERDNPYNIWFTVIASSQEDIRNFLKSVKDYTGIEEILELPAVDVFKIRASFFIKE
ncbi:MAG: Lrp/AsnC family transcriptional regulator [Clostridium sp.]|uniref:siroheme decarboxylase subunit alpha n=1 Tax=Clostridium sp. TaxID=1506 RepID=UPI0025C0A857|nr:Lrp/AsnC family transcriptional regulator [Clostridium sp.]MCH3963542.1 Lrp/AsnC family transcriptional regulator [Clostridium sp.]MCI1714683.1 Lrp/AsnC family transcriptional regulator [Clostridium sp.]MCI1799128.1 Lrp/AsnC family transcriptional regulator [Clostridium sp.]MCI1812866.1 Lrp/AsnC family transcriptional regulator [Clostridium sp.]MCI1869756.1 Lrp/AsnC family transcriptional regulator [Clostridium sp.]